MTIEHRLRVDWDGNRSFSSRYANVFGDLVPGSLRCTRGRSYGPQAVSQAAAGELSFTLRNNTGKYDPQNQASPLAGRLSGGQHVQFAMRDPASRVPWRSQWRGYLDEPTVRRYRTKYSEVDFRALGFFAQTAATTVDLPARTGVTTSAAATAIRDAVGVDPRMWSLAGTYVMGRWSPSGRWATQGTTGLAALRDLEEVERAALYEDRHGRIRLDAHTTRLVGGARNSALSIGGGAPGSVSMLGAPEVGYTQRDVVNIVTATAEHYTVGSRQDLWVMEQALTVPPAGVTLVVRYPSPGAPGDHVGVDQWTTPAAPADYARQTGLTVTATRRGDELWVSLANSTSSAIAVPSLRVRGTPVLRGDPTELRFWAQASRDAYGDHLYKRTPRFLRNVGDVIAWGEWILNVHSEPRGHPTVQWSAHDAPGAASSIDISRRVTISIDGRAADYFVEGVSHSLRADGEHVVTYVCSSTEVAGDAIILDAGPGLGTGTLL